MKTPLLTAAILGLGTGAALADCETIVFSDVGWTDITATTAVATEVLEGLGYETDVKVLSVPVTYQSLAQGDVDVFLGNWMPTMEADIAPYREAGTVDVVVTGRILESDGESLKVEATVTAATVPQMPHVIALASSALPCCRTPSHSCGPSVTVRRHAPHSQAAVRVQVRGRRVMA